MAYRFEQEVADEIEIGSVENTELFEKLGPPYCVAVKDYFSAKVRKRRAERIELLQNYQLRDAPHSDFLCDQQIDAYLGNRIRYIDITPDDLNEICERHEIDISHPSKLTNGEKIMLRLAL